MKVTMTADPGDWVQPSKPKNSESGVQSHQEPRRRAGLSHLRWKERRAAERAAGASPSAEKADQGTADDAPLATYIPAAIYVCVLRHCVQLTLGHTTFHFPVFCLPWPAEQLGLPLVSWTLCWPIRGRPALPAHQLQAARLGDRP